ncbi:MAG TPA: restriction endonuclease subunit S [Thermoanaerobaculia bacterium]|nr:restriction endonuclease subunit S [Thermoanaerobaculia bacterium]
MNERRRRMLVRGDLLLEKSGGGDQQPVGVVMLYDHDIPAVCSNFVARVPVSAAFDSGYLAYLHSHLYAIRLNLRSIKQTTGIQNLDSSAYLSEPAAFPPLREQSAIVRFLDHTDRRIRRYIRAKKKLIALLNEQKQAIIHRAVTRGLGPNDHLKPSGVEWLGEVPKHWEIKRLRNLTANVTSGSRGWSNYAADSGPLFIRIGNLTRASIELDLSDTVRLNLPTSVLGETTRTRVAPDDVLLSITAFIGSVAIVPSDIGEAYVSQHVACCRLAPGAANARWVGYVLLSPIGKIHGTLCMYGGTKQGLSLDDVRNHVVLLPPREEQDALVQRIEADTAVIDVASRATQREIDFVREYRTRLIADVVTGKLDVREAVARLPEEAEEPELLDEGEAMGEDEAEDEGGDLDALPEEAVA